MKKTIIIFSIGLLTQQVTQAQGTSYFSNLGENADGSVAVGSDSWIAASFITGNNVGGYLIDSVALGMASATGNPSDFMVMIYSPVLNPSVGYLREVVWVL